ncbi:MAG TPA: zinc-dependent alcohol dehydrogenase [Bryobacteraceae bacterium]
MKAVCWNGTHNVRVEEVADARILNHRDALVKVTLTAICGSDLHLYDGVIPTMHKGDILGHEFMGEVVEVGRDVERLKKGDRVVVPFTLSCGRCLYCRKGLWSLCENSNPNAPMAEAVYGSSTAGLFGYSHLFGGFAGGQAQYARVPFADVGPLPVPPELPDDQVLFLSDIFPTGYMAAENCDIQPGDTIAIWGCGPVGQFAIRSAYLLGAEHVVAIDDVPARLEMARRGGAEPLDLAAIDVLEKLKDLTGGRGPDACIDAVGMEAHGMTRGSHPIRQAIQACRPGGTVSIPGVYGGFIDKFPIGAAFAKGLTLKMGQTHVPRYMRPLLDRIRKAEIDPSFVITHRFPLDEAPEAYRQFRYDRDNCIKVVMQPN